MFFVLYFFMTGLHAIHMIIGIGLVGVMAYLSWRRWFSGGGATQIEVTGLYWHFVDIVWVFLYPLLYLIDVHSMSQHITPVRTYIAVFVALLVLLVATVGAAYLPLGDLHFPVAMTIAAAKAVLIVLFFMHVLHSHRLTMIVAGRRVPLAGDHDRADPERLLVAGLAQDPGQVRIAGRQSGSDWSRPLPVGGHPVRLGGRGRDDAFHRRPGNLEPRCATRSGSLTIAAAVGGPCPCPIPGTAGRAAAGSIS